MTDRMIQVPESLIEGMPHETDCYTQDWRYGDYYGEDLTRPCDCYRAKFEALLSQQADEPMDVFQAEAMRARRRTPEPPRIEDMAPGTTFLGALWGQQERLWFKAGETFVSTTGQRAGYPNIDPSTIRNVQPPKEKTHD